MSTTPISERSAGAAVPCIGEDENGEETDAVRLDLDNGHFVILTESEIKSYKILDTAFTDDT